MIVNKITRTALLAVVVLLAAVAGCKKLSRPALGDYPKDANPPGGPLKFYVAFDGTTSNAQMNAVDSIRANFPSSNPLSSITGISGKAIQGKAIADQGKFSDAKSYVKYASANDFLSTASSFSISFWEKRNGAPVGDAQFPISIVSSNSNQWAGTQLFILFDWSNPSNNDSAIIKVYAVDKNLADSWLTWEGGNKVKGIMDNNWHHLAFVYDATSSKLTLYVDGAANAHVNQWDNHGPINFDPAAAAGMNICGRPKDLGWGKEWDGGIDQMRLYAKALSASEVQALFTSKQ